MNHKKFQTQVNQSFDLQKAFQDWKAYRKIITDYITNYLKPGHRVLIIGAGALNDIDLSAMSNQNLTFLDIDEESLAWGLDNQGGQGHIVLADITGLNDAFHAGLVSAIESDELESFLSAFRGAYDFSLSDTFDRIVILPIYTQLIMPQYLPYLKSQEQAHRLMQFIGERIQYLHAALRQALRPEGMIIALSDVLEYERNSEEASYLLAHKDNPMILENHFQQYLSYYGHGMGSYGLMELSEEMTLISQGITLWPFDDQRLFMVKMQTVK